MLPSKENVKTISDMRENAKGLLTQVKSNYGPIYILYRSEPQAVLLSLEEFKKLCDLAEDYLDSLTAVEYEKKDKSKIAWLKHRELKKKLGPQVPKQLSKIHPNDQKEP